MGFDPVSYLMGKKTGGGGGGGGNPNYIETIEGTLANPWGEYDHDELWRSVLSRDISLILTITNSSNSQWETQAGSVTPRFFYGRKTMEYGVARVEGHYRVAFKSDGSFSSAVDADDEPVQSISDDSITTLTIIHHPMTGSLPMAEKTTFGGTA